jgi:CheY-like chemotaxis protein
MRDTLEILLVEDNEGDIEMTRRALKNASPACHLSIAHNGDQALEFLQGQVQADGKSPTQLILLDINMPRMDGKQFLSRIKAETALKAIPVVMFTSSQSPADIRDCYERHANNYVVKPFDMREYAAALQQLVGFWGDLSELPG